jgi:hypothetical protein
MTTTDLASRKAYSWEPPGTPAELLDRDRAALLLARTLFTDGALVGADLTRFGVEGGRGNFTIGDPKALPLLLIAGRAGDFGSAPIDEKIRTYLDGTYGTGRWRHDRPAHPWEPGGGDAELDRLHAAVDAAVAAREEAERQMWATRDEYRRQPEGLTGSTPTLRRLAHEAEEAFTRWEKLRDAESYARGQETNRALAIARQHQAAY